MAIEGINKYVAFSSSDMNTSYAEQKVADSSTYTTESTSTVSKSVEYESSRTGVESENEEKKGTDNQEHLKSALSVANQKIHMTNTRCEFEYHETTKRVSIKVIDKDTDEIVREIPPEETLKMIEKMWELAGLIVDEKC